MFRTLRPPTFKFSQIKTDSSNTLYLKQSHLLAFLAKTIRRFITINHSKNFVVGCLTECDELECVS